MQGELPESIEEHYRKFAPNVVERLEKLETFAAKVDDVLFVDKEGRPALATVAQKVNTHVDVLCTWANTLGNILRGAVRLIKFLAVVLLSLSAIGWTIVHFGEPGMLRHGVRVLIELMLK